MPIYAVWIINKAGGLSFQRDYHSSALAHLSANEYLVIASTFQSVHAIASQLDPLSIINTGKPSVEGASGSKGSGMEYLSFSPHFDVHCLQSPTGVKFILVTNCATPVPTIASATTPTTGNDITLGVSSSAKASVVLYRIWELYADYVCKNVMQVLEMPIRSELFEGQMIRLVSQYQKGV